MTRQCNWVQRWWHRRLRAFDRDVFISAVVQVQVTRGLMPLSEIERARRLFFGKHERAAWWQCPCAQHEIETRLLTALRETEPVQ